MMRLFFQLVAGLGILVLVQGCDAPQDGSGGNRLLANQSGGGAARSGGTTGIRALLEGRTADRRSVGSDELLALDRAGRGQLIEASGAGAFTLNLVDVPIEQAARAVLGDALQRNFTIAEDVSGTVTLQTTRPLSERDLLDTFETVLESSGASLQKSGSVLQIVRLSRGAQRVVGPNTPGGGGRVVAIPLEFIAANEMVRLLEPIVGESIRLQPIANRNVLLISGARAEINAAIESVNVFDVDVMRGKSTGLFRLRAAEPEAVVRELEQIFDTNEGGSLQNVVSFIPSQRLGAVLVITSRSNYLREAERWIRDLDNAASGTRRRPVVYNLQNRSADDLAPILSEMISDVASADTGSIEGSARVVADDSRNAVVVWGNDTEQEAFARLIHSLDTTPIQVLLEATIAEVTLNDELNFGLRWFFENGGLRGTLSDVASGAVTSNFPGLSFMFQGSSAAAAINALNSVTNVNVVSSPSLMVLDNQRARLQIGDQVPIATQQVRDTTDANAPVVNTITFRDTGIILSVRPRVSQAGQVVLEIEQEVSSVSNTTTSGIDSPTISQRRIQTSVVVQDNQTIALGGLIQDSRNRTNSQVPGAGSVPVVGALFRNRRDAIGRTELLVLITPRVVRDGHEASAVTAELRSRIRAANSTVQSGIVDPGIGHRLID